MELVTVAVAIYNADKYVKKMVESIIVQSYTNVEILLVNDGSTDDSLRICESISDPRIKIINKNNSGLSTARQVAINSASGQFICLVDADDYLDVMYIEKLYRAIKLHEADIAVCDYRQYHGRLVRYINVNTTLNCIKLTETQLKENYYKVGVDYILSDSWNKMYSVSFLQKTNVQFSLPKVFNGTDLQFNYLLALHSPKIAIVHEALYNYQVLQTSRVRRKDKDLQSGFMLITERLLRENEALGLGDEVSKQIYMIYLDLIRSALSDLFTNAENYTNFKDKYSIYKKKYFQFRDINFKAYSRTKLSTGMRLYLFLLDIRCTLPTYTYLAMRKSYIQRVVGKKLGERND